MRKFLLASTVVDAQLHGTATAAEQASLGAPGAVDTAEREVPTFITKDLHSLKATINTGGRK
jgi:hypothetical protein